MNLVTIIVLMFGMVVGYQIRKIVEKLKGKEKVKP